MRNLLTRMSPWFNALSILRHDSEVLYFTVVDIIWSYFILLLEYINIYFQVCEVYVYSKLLTS